MAIETTLLVVAGILLASSQLHFGTNLRVNSCIGDLVEFSVKQLEVNDTDGLKAALYRIRADLPRGGYEDDYMKSIAVVDRELHRSG